MFSKKMFEKFASSNASTKMFILVKFLALSRVCSFSNSNIFKTGKISPINYFC